MLHAASPCRCDNCDLVFPYGKLKDIENIYLRVEPGGIMPAGECPECGALCYPDDTRAASGQ